MRLVAALGGNALLRRGEPLTADAQRRNVAVAADAVAALAREHQVVVTHGNGPQVGLLALQNEAYPEVAPYPLDVLDAESEGMIGYLLEQELGRHLPRSRLATILTQVRVSPEDPAVARPTKFIGPVYEDPSVVAAARARGWELARDGAGWRRVVPSPQPLEIIELEAIRTLVDRGVTVLCAGGGGIPVVANRVGLHGVDAVIDKDLASALLATALGADALLLLTDVDAVQLDWGTPAARPLRRTTPAALRALHLPDGSMGPKAEAACRFVEDGGRFAAIGALADAPALACGEAGTIVSAE
jgi:carbamate kinase